MSDPQELLRRRVLGGDSKKHGAIWCFLGRVPQDAGQMITSKIFYEEGMKLDPDNCSYALNYVHLLEHMNKLVPAVEFLHNFLVKRGAVKVGINKAFAPDALTVANIIVGHRPVPESVIRTAEADCAGERDGPKGGGDDEKAAAAPWTVPVPALPADAIRLVAPPKSLSSSGDRGMGEFECVRYVPDRNSTSADANSKCIVLPTTSSSSSDDCRPLNNGLFGEEDLNVVGLYFTAVKLLFCIGALDRLPALIAAINPIRKFNQFHNTIMKNEHSYYTTVVLAMQFLCSTAGSTLAAAPPSSDAERLLNSSYLADPVNRCIYSVGDSHSVPCSWHVLRNYGGEEGKEKLIVNRLVTGLKCWHLRQEGAFYPKRQFEAVTATLPQAADVIFSFGEIDCREAALQVVERGLYETVEEVYRALGQMYLSAIVDVKRLRRLGRVFVLGPLPILDVTRHLVVGCNKVFAALFKSSKDAQTHRLVYIDPCDKVLCSKEENPSGQRSTVAVKAGEERVLRQEYHFDKTHIHPLFVSKVLGPAINEGLVATKKY